MKTITIISLLLAASFLTGCKDDYSKSSKPTGPYSKAANLENIEAKPVRGLWI